MYMIPETKLQSSDRVLSLTPIDGKKALSSLGVVDPRLFTGEQKLHIKMDESTTLWYFQYEQNGVLPEPLKGRFTGYKSALKHAENYFGTRNIKVATA